MFEPPAKRDIDYALSMLMHEARRRVADEKNRITSEAIKAGALQSNRVVITVADAADKIHAAIINEAKQTLIGFIQHMRKPAKEITAWARPHLENLSNVVLGGIPPNGFPQDHQRIIAQYQAVFRQRVDGALREIEIGYLRGTGFIPLENANAAVPQQAESMPPKLSDAIIAKPAFMGMGIDLSKFWQWLSQRIRRASEHGR
ncbi:MAG: hypothetical protein WB760_19570 [Xanthobacteraceae bacterium]